MKELSNFLYYSPLTIAFYDAFYLPKEKVKDGSVKIDGRNFFGRLARDMADDGVFRTRLLSGYSDVKEDLIRVIYFNEGLIKNRFVSKHSWKVGREGNK